MITLRVTLKCGAQTDYTGPADKIHILAIQEGFDGDEIESIVILSYNPSMLVVQ